MALFSRKQKLRQTPETLIPPEERAVRGLEAALSHTETDADTAEHMVLVGDALKAKQAQEVQRESEQADSAEVAPEQTQPEREKLRALLVTTDVALFVAGSSAETEYAALAEYLDELHIIVITFRDGAPYAPRRIAQNVWVYPTNSRSSLFALYDVYALAKKQLAFAAGFRADLVIAVDPFTAGIAAYLIAKRYDRPLQLQIFINPFSAEYLRSERGSKWRMFGARFVIPRADCIFVRSKRIQTVLERRYRAVAPRITLVPPFHNLASFKNAAPSFDLHERYPRFKFIILVVSRLDAQSRVDFAIDACAPVLLRYPTIGLVIVGEGPLRAHLERKAASGNLKDRIAFESDPSDLVSHMKSANLFLNVGWDEEHDSLIAAAAAAGLPVLTATGAMASALFEDGVNAFICPENDMVCLQARIGEFLNDNHLRATFSINARSQVFAMMDQDVESYRRAFVESLESCVLGAYPGAKTEKT